MGYSRKRPHVRLLKATSHISGASVPWVSAGWVVYSWMRRTVPPCWDRSPVISWELSDLFVIRQLIRTTNVHGVWWSSLCLSRSQILGSLTTSASVSHRRCDARSVAHLNLPLTQFLLHTAGTISVLIGAVQRSVCQKNDSHAPREKSFSNLRLLKMHEWVFFF